MLDQAHEIAGFKIGDTNIPGTLIYEIRPLRCYNGTTTLINILP
jgi:hypothetical protein